MPKRRTALTARSAFGLVGTDYDSIAHNPLTYCAELDDIVSGPSNEHELIDDALRAYLVITTKSKRTLCAMAICTVRTLTIERGVSTIGT